jgi:hypothetical protein
METQWGSQCPKPAMNSNKRQLDPAKTGEMANGQIDDFWPFNHFFLNL